MGPKRKTRIKLEKNNNRAPTSVRDPDATRNGHPPIRKRSHDPKDDPLEIVAAKKPRTDPFHARPPKLNGCGRSVQNGQRVASAQRFHVNRDAKSDRSLKVTLSKEPSVESVLLGACDASRNGHDADATGGGASSVASGERRAADPEPDDVASQRRAFDAWCEDTYGEHSRSKTVTLKKHARVVRALRGAADEDTSKFRFWVRAKGFRIDAPTSYARTPADRCVDGRLRADPALFIPDKNGTYRKVAIVEDFFDIIYNVHVDLEGRPGKHAGQKRTYRTITETFAFLPREAVTHFLAGCHACQRRPRSPQSGPSPSLPTPSPSPTPGVQCDAAPRPIPASAAPTNYQESFENTLTDLAAAAAASTTTTPTTTPPTKRRDDHDDVQDNKLSSTTFRASRTPDAASRPARYSKTHLLLRRDDDDDDDRRRRRRHHRRREHDPCRPCDLSTGGGRSDDASATEPESRADRRAGGEYRAGTSATSGYCGEFKIDRDRNGGVDGGSRAGQLCRDSRGQEFDLNMPITHALLRHAPPSGHHIHGHHNHHQHHHQQHQQQQHENMPTPDSADAVEDNHFGGVVGGGGVTTAGDANALPADHIAAGLWANYHAAALNLGKVGTPPVVPREQSSPVLAETGSAHDETSSSGNKDDEDDDDDESDDRIDAHTHDPERLKAFNMFVRLFVDENLDRMVPISKQPKEKIQAIIDSCTRQFPEFAERARKRIRTYLKSCRRNKRARDPSVSSPWDAARPTPAHLTSAQAEQILATACENESANAKRMRVGLEPVSQPMPTTASNTQPVDATAPIRDAVDFVARATVASRPTARDPTPPSAAQSHNGGVVGAAAAAAASAYRPPPGFPTHVQERAPPGIDLSVDKHTAGAPPPRPLLTHKLSAGEMAAVRQLVTGYRESAAFLLRSADELEQLLLQQQ